MTVQQEERAARIRELNDRFRSSFSGGRVMVTCGVADLSEMVKAKALQLVASFDDFTEDNDPSGEHDFGSFELGNREFFWKIDYYDERCEFRSEDPSDAQRTTRVLTLMLASEY
jgi:Protein of unknown function (DUF3768)